jgi:Cu(I)/Ag(I) efflux system periplasmic protein CusF
MLKKLALVALTTVFATYAYTQTEWASGEVKKVDLAQGKVTIQHGELVNLGMPPMRMVFTTEDPAMLEGVKVDDRVRFVADKKNGRYVVVKLEKK